MQIGGWKITHCLAGRFGLDGGAMFGVVPRTMWARGLPPDEHNRVPMVMRVLLVQGHGKTVIVDVGSGRTRACWRKASLRTIAASH